MIALPEPKADVLARRDAIVGGLRQLLPESGMNSGGAHCLKYGVTANNLLGLKLVTVEGEVLEIGGTHLDAAGYDWLGLITGSEGQLGIITEVTVRILPGPEGARAMLAAFRSN